MIAVIEPSAGLTVAVAGAPEPAPPVIETTSLATTCGLLAPVDYGPDEYGTALVAVGWQWVVAGPGGTVGVGVERGVVAVGARGCSP